MSVTSCKEIRESPTGATYDDKGVRTYEREFVVVCTTHADGPMVVLAASGLPAIGSAYSFSNDGADATAKCTRLRPRRYPNSDVHWKVTAEYSTRTKDPDENNTSSDPLDMRPRVRWTSARERKPLMKSYSGGTEDLDVDVVNTADDPFIPAIEYEAVHSVATITRNQTEHPDPDGTYIMSVNQSAFAGWGAGAVLLYNIGAELDYFKGTRFYSVSFELHFAVERHKIFVASTGLRQIGLVDAGNKVKIYDKKSNTPITKPVGLNDSGQEATSAAEIAYLSFWPYPFKDWSILNIPDPYTIGL